MYENPNVCNYPIEYGDYENKTKITKKFDFQFFVRTFVLVQ